MKIFKNTGYEVAIKGYGWQQGINYDGMIVGSRTCAITAIKIYIIIHFNSFIVSAYSIQYSATLFFLKSYLSLIFCFFFMRL